MPRCAIGPARLRWVFGHRALFRVMKFAMSKFPAPAAPEQQPSNAVKRQVRFLAQALDGTDPSVVEVGIVLDPILGFDRNEKAFARVFLNPLGRNVAAAGGNVDCDAFRRGMWKRSLDGVAHTGNPVLLLPPWWLCFRSGHGKTRPTCDLII